MNPDVAALFTKAERSLANARLSLQASDSDFAASRAYYAMFYAVEALLLSRGHSFSKHSAVIAEFNREFVHSGELPQTHAVALRDAFDQRAVADYQYREPFPPERAKVLIDRAAAFLRDADSYLRKT